MLTTQCLVLRLQHYGLTLYEAWVTLPSTASPYSLFVNEIRDRVQVFVDGSKVGTVYRPSPANVSFAGTAGSRVQLRILVENMGRINYGREMYDPKGNATIHCCCCCPILCVSVLQATTNNNNNNNH